MPRVTSARVIPQRLRDGPRRAARRARAHCTASPAVAPISSRSRTRTRSPAWSVRPTPTHTSVPSASRRARWCGSRRELWSRLLSSERGPTGRSTGERMLSDGDRRCAMVASRSTASCADRHRDGARSRGARREAPRPVRPRHVGSSCRARARRVDSRRPATSSSRCSARAAARFRCSRRSTTSDCSCGSCRSGSTSVLARSATPTTGSPSIGTRSRRSPNARRCSTPPNRQATGSTATSPVARAADVLLLAALLHDIAKGQPGDHSVVGVELARSVAGRIGLDDHGTERAGVARAPPPPARRHRDAPRPVRRAHDHPVRSRGR